MKDHSLLGSMPENNKRIRVFHGIVNYGSQASLLARALRKLGIDAAAYTQHDVFGRETDFSFRARKNIFLKAIFYKLIYPLVKLYCFFRYNTFHFYFGKTLTKSRWDLPFYRIFGKKVLMEYLGNDIRSYRLLNDRYGMPVEQCFGESAEKHDNKVQARVDKERPYLDYILACLPTHIEFGKEYSLEIDEILPLAIDLSKIDYDPLSLGSDALIKIAHAPTSRGFKGTEIIAMAVEKLQAEGLGVELVVLEGLAHSELLTEIRRCHIFIDQISVGWYGTVALEAMAIGRPTCAFIDKSYLRHVDYGGEMPVINVIRANIADVLRDLIGDIDGLCLIGARSRKFVEEHHDVQKIALQLKRIYQEKVWKKKHGS